MRDFVAYMMLPVTCVTIIPSYWQTGVHVDAKQSVQSDEACYSDKRAT